MGNRVRPPESPAKPGIFCPSACRNPHGACTFWTSPAFAWGKAGHAQARRFSPVVRPQGNAKDRPR